MNTYELILKKEILENKGIKDHKTEWYTIFLFINDLLKLDNCMMFSFCPEKFEAFLSKNLLNYKIFIEGKFLFFQLDVETYIQLLELDDKDFYSSLYEDPKLFSHKELKVECISHEYTAYLYINEEEKNIIQN